MFVSQTFAKNAECYVILFVELKLQTIQDTAISTGYIVQFTSLEKKTSVALIAIYTK